MRPLALDRPDSVRAFAKGWLAENRALHLLLNNAGVMACPLARTSEGWELQFATNHLGHFLLSALLVPALRAAGAARVANTSSGGHRFSPVVFEDIHFERRPYDKWAAYGQAKSANVLHAVQLDRRLAAHGVRAFGVHPGMIVTELGRHLTPDDIAQLQSRAKERSSSGMATWKTPQQGAATQCWAVTAPELAGRGGLYLEDCQVSGTTPPPGSLGAEAPWPSTPRTCPRPPRPGSTYSSTARATPDRSAARHTAAPGRAGRARAVPILERMRGPALPGLLAVLAGVAPCRQHTFGVLRDAVRAKRASMSGALAILLAWDEPRRAFVDEMRSHGLALRVLVVSARPVADAPPWLKVLVPGRIQEGLATL